MTLKIQNVNFSCNYPFGWVMPGRELVSSNKYRFGYQGEFSEKDDETGWNSFELRSLDTRIGRWMTIDPYHQYASPYVSMGNTPINGVDPDGGVFGKWRAKMWAKRHGGTAYQLDDGRWTGRASYIDPMDGSGGTRAKNFGYGGLGKLTITGQNSSMTGKVNFGLLQIVKDKGIKGYAVSGPNITLLETKINYDHLNNSLTDETYYAGKDGVWKGKLYSLKLESPKGDFKMSQSWGQDGNTVKLNPVVVGTGVLITEIKAELTKNGMTIHFGLQEDWGGSIPALPYNLGSFAISIDLRSQSKIRWDY